MCSQVRFKLQPGSKCLYDAVLWVKVMGLRPKQRVTFKATSSDDKGVMFRAHATYRADESGEVDVGKDESLGGSYSGVASMGWLTSMKADVPHARFHKVDARKPCLVRLTVSSEERPGEILAEEINERFLLGEGVRRIPVREENFRGVLFIPPGKGPFPAVLDLCTIGGGLSEKRASLLANKGFVVLALALDLPEHLREFHLEYFEEAIKFLNRQEEVGSCGVGVISRSKAGDLALSIATFLPGVAATVWINGSNANTVFPLCYRGREILPPLMFDVRRVTPSSSGAFNVKRALDSPSAEENKATLVPIEQARGRFLFVASQDDLNWDSSSYLDQMVARLRFHGRENCEWVCYGGAGHYLEPPYTPYCPSSFHRLLGKPVLWGGMPPEHAAAEVDLWNRVQGFFRTHLVPEKEDRPDRAKL